MPLLLQLFLSYLKIGVLSLGGGHASLPVVRQEIVNVRGWMTAQEFLDMITISEITPGPLSINSATFIGSRMAGIPGGFIATLGCMLPSLIICLILVKVFDHFKKLWQVKAAFSGLRPAVTGMILASGVGIIMTSWFGTKVVSEIVSIDWIAVILFAGALILLLKKKPNPVLVILGCGVLGMGIYHFFPIA